MPRNVGVVVVAAGQGTRAGGPVPKQYQLIAGVPMIIRALRPFLSHDDVAQVALVLPETDAAVPPAFLDDVSGNALILVAGGPTRTDSAARGLRALGSASTVVLVHDGARPFVDRHVIDSVIALARQGEAAIAAVPIGDTIKEALPHDDTCVARTLPRERLWRAQTPQGFPRAMLERAYALAALDPARATDDAELVERAGNAVRLVPDSPRNLKVTTPADLVLAELIAASAP